DEPSAAELDHYKSAAPLDYRAARFQEWLGEAGLRRGPAEGDMAFARRAFLYLKRHFHYEYYHEGMDQTPPGRCRARRSACAGRSRLFVSVRRANRVAAREAVGRMAQSQEARPTGGTEYQDHVQAEFFIADVGWIPVDMTGAVADPGGGFAF